MDNIIFEKLLLRSVINRKWVACVKFVGVLLYNIQKHSLKWPHFRDVSLLQNRLYNKSNKFIDRVLFVIIHHSMEAMIVLTHQSTSRTTLSKYMFH